MAITTQSDPENTDAFGIERSTKDDPSAVDKVRARSPFVDHIMRMIDRYNGQGGNQFAAGVTYFSVLAILPLFMLVVAAVAMVLSSRPDLLQQLQAYITSSVSGDFGDTLVKVLNTAIAQRGAMFGIGGLTTLWSGLSWIGHLRVGISAMWSQDPTDAPGNIVTQKLSDLLGLIGLLLAFNVAFTITVAGSSGLTQRVFEYVGMESFPGMSVMLVVAGIVVGLIANFFVFWWMISFLPRTKVPRRSGLYGALIGAVAFEVIKQLFTVIMAMASGNPAGALFGPIIVLMVVMYLIWRVVLYASAWTATTEESLLITEESVVPAPAIIRVRNEVKQEPSVALAVGVGAVMGATVACVAAAMRFRRR